MWILGLKGLQQIGHSLIVTTHLLSLRTLTQKIFPILKGYTVFHWATTLIGLLQEFNLSIPFLSKGPQGLFLFQSFENGRRRAYLFLFFGREGGRLIGESTYIRNYGINRVLKCDVTKNKFVKLWDLSRYSEKTTSKTPTCQKLEFRGKLSLRYQPSYALMTPHKSF